MYVYTLPVLRCCEHRNVLLSVKSNLSQVMSRSIASGLEGVSLPAALTKFGISMLHVFNDSAATVLAVNSSSHIEQHT